MKKMNDFLKILTICSVILLPLIGVIYNNLNIKVNENSNKIEEKVDNKTLKMLLDQQNIIIKNNKEEFDRVYTELRDIKLKMDK
jgi:hypothetical protein